MAVENKFIDLLAGLYEAESGDNLDYKSWIEMSDKIVDHVKKYNVYPPEIFWHYIQDFDIRSKKGNEEYRAAQFEAVEIYLSGERRDRKR